ncbi:MAG: DUF1801 domain-containing protein [Bacteroidota bacterium]
MTLRAIDQYYESQQEPNRSCLIALRDFILSLDDGISHEWKYHMPMFVYKKRMLCYIRTDQKTGLPYIGIVKGDQIDHPLLLQGNRKKMKVMEISPESDLPVDTIKEILDEALTLY